MDWSDLAAKVIGLGAPILGGALGGPLGAAAGKILADALGAAESTPAAVSAALDGPVADPTAAALAAQQAESQWLAALAEIGKAQVAEIGLTQRAETCKRGPLAALVAPALCAGTVAGRMSGLCADVLHALWLGHDRRDRRICQSFRLADDLFRCSFRGPGRLCHRPDPGKAGQRDRANCRPR